jgi:recombination protein RecA
MAVRKKKKPKMNALMAARVAVGKALKDDDPTVNVDPNSLKKARPHIPSGSVALNYLIGGRPNRYGVAPCPGWPRGGVSQIYGHESSGKTTVALFAAAAVCAAGGMVCFIDWEHALDLSYARGLGVPVDDQTKFYLVQPNTLEDGMKVMWATAAAGIDLIILDSISAGVPEEVFKQTLEKTGHIGRVGLMAAKWSSFLPKVASLVNTTGTHVMGISQLRKKINTGGYGGDTTQASGGEAWKFYSYVRMKFTRIKSEKGKVYNALTHKMEEQTVSSVIKAKIDKSKVSGSQQHTGEFYVVFGDGIDDLRTCIEVCVNHKKITKGGAWYTFERKDGTTIKSCGLPAFKQDLAQIPGAMVELTKLAMSTLQVVGAQAPVIVEEEDEGIDLSQILSGADVDLDALLSDEEPVEEPG